MSEKPLLLNAEMVRATLDGRKTHTRRPIKPQPVWIESSGRWSWSKNGATTASREWWEYMNTMDFCPFGQAGDRLWVRETFWSENETCDHEYCGGCDMGPVIAPDYKVDVDYVATPRCLTAPECEHNQTFQKWSEEATPGYWWLAPPSGWDGNDYSAIDERGEWGFMPWRFFTKHPSIHMPRWASRINLLVKRVWVERIQNISLEDVYREGCTHFECGSGKNVVEFYHLWNSIYAKRGLGWDANPWVWACEFEKVPNA